MYQQKLVPRQGCLEGLLQVATLSLQEAREGRLCDTHRPDHKLWWHFPAWAKYTMAVRQAYSQEVIGEVVRHGHCGRFPQPAPEAMFASIEPLHIRSAIRCDKKTSGGGEFEEVFVEGCRNGLLMFENGRRAAPNQSYVRVIKPDKLHDLTDKPLHVGAWMIARLAAHMLLSLVCDDPVLRPCVVRLYGMQAKSVKRFPRVVSVGIYQRRGVPVYNDQRTTGRSPMFFLLSKFLNWLVYPVSLLFVGLLVILVFYRRRYARWGLAFILLLFYSLSAPITVLPLVRWLEGPRPGPEALRPHYDVAIVLTH
jgi:hypothetical protein